MKLPSYQDIEEYVLNHPIITGTQDWLKSHSMPGFFSVPLWEVLVFLNKEFKRFDLFTRANSMAYSFFISLFPTLIALFTLLPYLQRFILQYLPMDFDFEETLRGEIIKIVPGQVGESIFEFIEDITTNPRVGLLSFGFVLALYFASNGMISMMTSFEKTYKRSFVKRNAFQNRFIAVMLTFLLSVLVVGSVLLIVMGNFIIAWIAQYLKLDWFSGISLELLRWTVIIGLLYIGIAYIYRYGGTIRQKFGFISPGSTLATMLCILSSIAFSFYVDNFGNYNKFYGSIGTIIILMLWIQINSLFLLIGYELNASIAFNRDLNKRIVRKNKQSEEEVI